jgi:serine/threonine protein kinase
MASRKSAIDMLPLTPTKLGRYEIVDEIGKGAMGVVFLARDPLIGRLVALKTFRIGYSIKDQELEQFRIRFMREAQSAGILTHPHIVTIHDVVEASDEGLAFIAMEYVRGTNLKLLLQGEQPMSLATALDIISQVGDALDYAHANRVIHRDVKPANILITTENRVKITDFGIARLESSNLTQEGQLLGTPNYMAPEQIQGKEVDHRADLFSLGVVLYEMLTRHKPFQGENLTVVSHRIVYDHFTPPREYVRDLPPGVDRVLAKALEKDPGRRYQRAKEMVEDLRQAVETASVRPDELNETQSLSSTMVLPPPLPPPPSATAPAAPAAGPESPDLSDTVATELPVLTPPRRRPSPRRLLAVGGITLALALLLGVALLLWARSLPTGKQRDAKEDSKRALVLALLHQGSDERVRGNWLGAAALFHQADLIAPGRRGIQSMRRTAEAKSQIPQQPVVNLGQQIDFGLQGAKQALEAKNYEAAASMAGGVLIMDSENVDAKAFLAKAQEGLTKKNKRPAPANPRTPRRADQQAAAMPALSEAQPARANAPAVAPTTATVRVHFHSEPSEGSLIIWVNDQEVWRDNFGSRNGFGAIFRHNQEPHDSTKILTVSAGSVHFRVHVSAAGKPAQVKQLTGNLSGGSSRSLEIHLSGPTQLTADLN